MPPTGVTDLAAITDKLLAAIRTAIQAAQLSFTSVVSGAMPESVRADGNVQVSLYLYHVSADATARNSHIAGSQISRQRPLGLELNYLLTVFSGKEYAREQHVMTIAMRALQDLPYLRTGANSEELTVTLATEGIDKLGILWQAVNAPFRLTAIYRVGVAFIAPTEATPVSAPKPTAFTLTVDPTELPFGDAGQLLGTSAHVTYMTPASTPGNLATRTLDLSPAVVAQGARFTLWGANLLPSDSLFLLDADGSNERDVTAWKVPDPAQQTSTRLLLELPANAPPPGIYQLRTGSGTSRSNGVAVSISAAITGVGNPPILNAGGGTLTVTGAGFVTGKTEVLLESVSLTEVAGAPGPGEFQITGGTSIALQPPSGMAAGRYGLRVRVGGVESAPSWWVAV